MRCAEIKGKMSRMSRDEKRSWGRGMVVGELSEALRRDCALKRTPI